jgi:hypothetical protein
MTSPTTTYTLCGLHSGLLARFPEQLQYFVQTPIIKCGYSAECIGAFEDTLTD